MATTPSLFTSSPRIPVSVVNDIDKFPFPAFLRVLNTVVVVLALLLIFIWRFLNVPVFLCSVLFLDSTLSPLNAEEYAPIAQKAVNEAVDNPNPLSDPVSPLEF